MDEVVHACEQLVRGWANFGSKPRSKRAICNQGPQSSLDSWKKEDSQPSNPQLSFKYLLTEDNLRKGLML
jgi:hypothetical protein